jgi:hypothetical protein
MIDNSTSFKAGEMVRFEGTYLLCIGDKKQMIITILPRSGVVVKVLDLEVAGLKHQLLEVYSDNEVCIVRTGMPDTVIISLQDTE